MTSASTLELLTRRQVVLMDHILLTLSIFGTIALFLVYLIITTESKAPHQKAH